MSLPRPIGLTKRTAHHFSLGLSNEQYPLIAQIARRNRAPIACVVREAIERKATEGQPLLRRRGRQT